MNQSDAEEGSGHLNSVRYIRLATRNRAVAIPQLRAQLRDAPRKPHTDAPGPPEEKRRGILKRILRRKAKTEDDELNEEG